MLKLIHSASQNRLVWKFMLLSAVFWAVWFVTSDSFALVFSSSLMFSSVAVMASVFIWVMLKIVRDNHQDRVGEAIVTFAGFMGSSLFVSAWRSAYLVLDRPPGMYQHPLFSYALYIGAVSLLFMIYVWWSDPEVPVSRRRKMLGASLGIGIMLGLMTWWFDLAQFLPFEI